jgi:hypothetical protein
MQLYKENKWNIINAYVIFLFPYKYLHSQFRN